MHDREDTTRLACRATHPAFPSPPPPPRRAARVAEDDEEGTEEGNGERGGANRKTEDRNVLPPASSSRAALTSAVKRSLFRWLSVSSILAKCPDARASSHSWCCSSVSPSGGVDLLMNLSIPVFMNSPGSFMRLVEIYGSEIVTYWRPALNELPASCQ